MVAVVLAGALAFAWQVVCAHAYDEREFAPLAAAWSMSFVVAATVALAVEQFASRSSATAGEAVLPLASVCAFVAGAFALALVAAVGLADRVFAGDLSSAVAGATAVPALSALCLVRGAAAGAGRTSTYALTSVVDGAARLALAIAAVSAGAPASVTAWSIPLGTLAIAPWFLRARAHPRIPADRADLGFLLGILAATICMQVILAGGPIVAGLIGSTRDVSFVFVEQVGFRPLVFLAVPLSTFAIAWFAREQAAGRRDAARQRAVKLLAAGSLAAALVGLVGAAVGPALIAHLFDSADHQALSVGLTAAATTVAATATIATQAITATSAGARPGLLWAPPALLFALVLIALDHGDVPRVIAWAFVVAELLALALLAVAIGRTRRDP